MKQITGMAVLAGAVALLLTSGCAAWRVGQSAEMARRSEPYRQTPPDALLRLLIVGDSTAVGTGASSPAHSLAGLIGRQHPRLLIENRAKDGAKFADVASQLTAPGAFDVVLVQAGGNDVIRMTGLATLQRDVDRVADLASARGQLVLLMPSGNVGNAPFFFAPLSWLMTDRARSLQRFVKQAADRTHATHVNLFRERADDPFVLRPELNAADGLHPSNAGYEVWLAELLRQSDLSSLLAVTSRPSASSN